MQQAGSSDLDVVVIGSALVELTPERPGHSLEDAECFIPTPGGSAANFAVALAALGARVGFLSRVGQDELGRWLIKRLAGHGIDTDLIKPASGHLTPVSFCWADRSGQKTFYFYRVPEFSDPMGTLNTATLDDQGILRAKILDFTEAAIRAQPLRDAALYAANIARDAGRTVCYAVNYRPSSWSEPLDAICEVQKQAIAAADLVLMNQQEACFIFQTDDASQALAAAQASLPERPQLCLLPVLNTRPSPASRWMSNMMLAPVTPFMPPSLLLICAACLCPRRLDGLQAPLPSR